MFQIFSTREIAVIIWSIIFIVIAISLLKLKAVLNLLKSFLSHKIQIPLWLMFIYIAAVSTCLYFLSFWNIGLLKDTILWTLTSATILFFNVNNAKDSAYFKPVILDNLKAIVILEFITNFYTFSFTTEMIIIPIMTFIGILQITAEHTSKTNPEHLKVASCLKKIFTINGIFIILYVGYETYKYYNELLTVQNIKSLLLPFVLTIFLIPFLYLLALYMTYETLFIRIPYLVNDKKKRKKLKLNILLSANLNLNKLNKINRNLNWNTIEKYSIKKSLRKILNKTSL